MIVGHLALFSMVKRIQATDDVAAALLMELARLRARIQRLQRQEEVLMAAIAARSAGKLNYARAMRKNTFKKLNIERIVMGALLRTNKAVSIIDLYTMINSQNTSDPIPNSTFRSHIHRMKLEGRIISGERRGTYKLANRNTDINQVYDIIAKRKYSLD